MPSSLVVRGLRVMAAGCLVALLAPSSSAQGLEWTSLPRLTDVRHDGASDVTALVTGGGAAVELPWAVSLERGRSKEVVVGLGWMAFVMPPPPATSLTGVAAPPADGGGLLRVDVLSGDDVAAGPLTRVLVTVEPDGLAVRWIALATPLGPATVEAIVDRAGRLTLQHLSLPRGADRLRVRAGLEGAPLTPAPATSRRLALGPRAALIPPRAGDASARPKRNDPPPPGCAPEAGTWCERADGPGTSQIWLSEGFDDLGATGRGWLATGAWHAVSYATCTPGASSNPGGAMYHGSDGSCSYAPLAVGSLVSPAFGPVSAGSQFVFSSRFEYEGGGFDLAQIYVNGTLIGDMPTGLDPALWWNFNPISLDAWAGQMVQIEFYFESDSSMEYLGWFVDDVIAWNPNVANPDCVKSAGHGPYSACDDRLDTRWTFNESRFCADCAYSFYVLVECGREMHLPLEDIEGVDLRISNVVDPMTPPPLRCVNQTARADAGLAPYPGYLVPDASGAALDCCTMPTGPEVWWSPAFDVTDNAGPGHVTWGRADGCPVFTVYDDEVPPNGVDCTELPGTCGGVLSRVSPGEGQVVDCYIEDPVGLCGLYRVDVISGGNVWYLFANCDGTNTPQFPIFFDCTEAWTAYNPLPELSVANLVVTGTCPDLTVDFDVVNLGCQEHPGDAVVRIEASGADPSCIDPPVTIDHVVTGPIAPGTVTHVQRTISAPCSPARVAVAIDPDNLVAECTETPGAAACRTDVGLDTITSFTCGCTAQLTPQAGADVAACPFDVVRLDGSASVVDPCARPLYRWLDESGTVLRDWSAVPTYDVLVRCPADRTYTLEVSCEGESCTESDTVTVSCISLSPDAGADAKACTGDGVTLDGSASVFTNCAAPIYRWFDPAGNEVRGWSPDPVLALSAVDCDAAGEWVMEVSCAGATCTGYDTVLVECVQVLADAGPDLPACEGVPVTITGAGSAATGCSSVLYQWVDTNGDPVSGVLTDPEFTVTLNGCPGVATLVLVAACADTGFENCGTFDVMQIQCGNPQPPVPVVTPTCGGADLACGAAEPGVTYWWDTDTSLDSDLNLDPADDRDVAACDGTAAYPDATPRQARAWAEDALGCRAFADADVAPLAAPPVPSPSAVAGCPGTDTELHCGSTEPSVTWDVDIASDSSGNGVGDDDADLTGCDVTVAYPAGTVTARVTVTSPGGCSSFADVTIPVPDPIAPPEVTGDRLSRSGAALTIAWDATPGSVTHRVSRGTIGTWYDHAADAPSGGTCDTGGALTWTDPDDATDGGDWYYLVTAVETCGLEGTPGNGFNGTAPFPRAARVPTATCP